ncbi:MAG: trigger factor [Lachnospiraceae bacterium]|nr:trigger factor [Lachnospiraceae bacterium]
MEEKTIQVTLAPYKGVQVSKREVTVTEQEILSEMNRARGYASRTEDKPDGSAEMGDQVVIDFIGYIDDEPFEGGDGTDYPIVLGSNTFIPGFEEQLVGAKAGDTVDVRVPFPENYHAKEYAGRDAVFRVTVKSLRSTIVPEMTDEVVSRISPCSTVEEFRSYVEDQIRSHKADQFQQEKENEVLEHIVERSEITVPEELVLERAEILKNNLIAQLRSSGNTLEAYLDYNNLTPEMFDAHSKNDALNMLKGQAVLAEIARAESFGYSPEELMQELFTMARSYRMTVDELREKIGEKGVEMVGNDILHRQALDFITNHSIEV